MRYIEDDIKWLEAELRSAVKDDSLSRFMAACLKMLSLPGAGRKTVDMDELGKKTDKVKRNDYLARV